MLQQVGKAEAASAAGRWFLKPVPLGLRLTDAVIRADEHAYIQQEDTDRKKYRQMNGQKLKQSGLIYSINSSLGFMQSITFHQMLIDGSWKLIYRRAYTDIGRHTAR